MSLPLRTRLTLVFTAGAAVLLAALGAFLYLRLGHDLMAGIDLDLRSRAQVVLGALDHGRPALIGAEGHLIDPDEAFAQVLSPEGRILDSSSAVAGAPMLSSSELRTVRGQAFFTTRVRGVDD